MTLPAHRSETALACLLACAALVGCNQNQTPASSQAAAPPPLPLTTAAPAPSAPAPSARALPPAPAADIAYQDDPAQQYAYADRAADLADALGDAPPDYSYDDDDGSQPWVWRGDGYLRLAESTPDGERYYYYDAGSPYPYLVQDGADSYAYANGALVVVYGPDGRALSARQARARLDLAGRYLARARGLYNDALSRQRQAVALQSWQDRGPAIQAQRDRWAAEQTRLSAWSAYHQVHQAQDNAQWSAERDRRTAEARQYARGPGGPAPAPAPNTAPAPGGLLPQPRRDIQQPRQGPPPSAPGGPLPQPSPKGPQPTHEHGPGPNRPPSPRAAQQGREHPPQPAAAPAAPPHAPPPVQHEPGRPAPAAPLAAQRQAPPPQVRVPDHPPAAPRAAERAPPAAPPAARPAAAPQPKAPPHPGEPPRPDHEDKKQPGQP